MSLSSLPPELVAIIVGYVDRCDLQNLRLTCKSLNAISVDRFGRESLSDLSFIFSRHSLQGLVALTAHPLGQYLQRIMFDTHLFSNPELDFVPEKYTDRAKEMSSLVESGEHARLITQALRNVRERGGTVELGFYDDMTREDATLGKARRNAYGFKEFYSRDIPYMDYWTPLPHLVFESISEAAKQARHPLNKLFLHLDDEKSFPLESHSEMRKGIQNFLFSTSGNLKSDIELTVDTHFWRGGKDSHLNIKAEGRKFTFSTQRKAGVDAIKHPKVEFIGLEPYNIVEAGLTRNAFREINFTFCAVELEFLMEFLRDQADSLRVLTLVDLDLDFYEDDFDVGFTPLTFLRMLRDEMKLEYLMMHRVRNIGDESRLVGGKSNVYITKEEVQTGLQAYIEDEENGEHSVDEEWDDEDEWQVPDWTDDENEGDEAEDIPGALVAEGEGDTHGAGHVEGTSDPM